VSNSNALREIVEDGSVAFGAQTVTHSEAIVEVYGTLGLDFVWVDFEHIGPSPYDSTFMEGLARAAELVDIELLARIPEPEPAIVRKVLDSGVRNVLVPRIETAEQVRAVVEASRFRYEGEIGDRGIGGVRANTYGLDLSTEYVDQEDRTAMVGVMIENETALDNLEDILSVPELGFIVVGHNDLAVSMGFPGDPDRSEVAETVSEVRQRAGAAGVPVGAGVEDTDAIRSAIDDGVQIVRISGGEVSALHGQIAPRLEELDTERA
jgi:2-dehydro-3-deoxyglucarate aldolase